MPPACPLLGPANRRAHQKSPNACDDRRALRACAGGFAPGSTRRSRSGRGLDAWSGARCWALRPVRCSAAAIDGVGAGAGGLIGVLVYAPAEAVTA